MRAIRAALWRLSPVARVVERLGRYQPHSPFARCSIRSLSRDFIRMTPGRNALGASIVDAMASPDPLQAFIKSMPRRYAQMFDRIEIEQHARIARERGDQLAHVSHVVSLGRRGTGLCVVAADSPGLLASISAALTSQELGILQAEIFTRRLSPSANEAVDLFWVVRTAPLQNIPITANDVLRLRQCMIECLRRNEVVPRARTSAFIGRSPDSSTRVQFIEDSAGSFATLEIEADDRSGLLLAVCQCLFAADLQIVGSRIKSENGRAWGRFEVLEFDERPIAVERRHGLQMAVLSAIDRLAGGDATQFSVG